MLTMVFGLAVYMVAGLALGLWLDHRPHLIGLFDRLGLSGEGLALLLWPIAFPWLVRRHRRRGR